MDDGKKLPVFNPFAGYPRVLARCGEDATVFEVFRPRAGQVVSNTDLKRILSDFHAPWTVWVARATAERELVSSRPARQRPRHANFNAKFSLSPEEKKALQRAGIGLPALPFEQPQRPRDGTRSVPNYTP